MSFYIVPIRNHTTALCIAVISALHSGSQELLILQDTVQIEFHKHLLCTYHVPTIVCQHWILKTPMVSNGTFSFPIQYLSQES